MCEEEHCIVTIEDGEPPAKRVAPSIQLGAGFKWNLQALSAAADAVQCGGKSPVSALNELGVNVTYSVRRQSGPAHCPSFNVCVTVADMVFEGAGHSKREARASAARACLAALLARAGRVLPRARPPTDFAEDDVSARPASEFQCLEAKNRLQDAAKVDAESKPEINGKPKPAPAPPTPAPAPQPAGDSPAASLFGAPAAPAVVKSPINLLYENYPGLVFHCTFGDGTPLDTATPPMQLSHSMRFKVVCQIKEQTFEGYGSSKKLAKLAAARAALATLDEGRAEPSPILCSPRSRDVLPQTLADYVSKLVNERFNELMRDDVVHAKRKVLAGIVITIDNQIEGAKLIGVTTGTKCVSGEHMSVRGRTLNDCHAEVAARRCLQRHLYSQLAMYAMAPDPSQPIAASDLEPVPGGGYRLKPSRAVHLYVSTAPCGDGRIFSPHEQPQPQPDRHPNRLARGQLRTKIESGEGTIPIKNTSNVIQTWDGVLQGERLLTMSCSDKVARWCVVGLQGSLLSLFLKPVYLHALVLGSLLHPAHMYRAICGRFENSLSGLPPPFALQRPLLARAASAEARSPARAPSFSVCWSASDKVPEVVNAMTGKLESGQPSLLCKQSMFARWQYLAKRLRPLPQSTELAPRPVEIPSNVDQLLYSEAKQLCPAYQTAKERLFDAFSANKLGRWVKKPLEQDQFVCELLDAEPGTLFAWGDSAPEKCACMPPGVNLRMDGVVRGLERLAIGDTVAEVGDRGDVGQVKDEDRCRVDNMGRWMKGGGGPEDTGGEVEGTGNVRGDEDGTGFGDKGRSLKVGGEARDEVGLGVDAVGNMTVRYFEDNSRNRVVNDKEKLGLKKKRRRILAKNKKKAKSSVSERLTRWRIHIEGDGGVEETKRGLSNRGDFGVVDVGVKRLEAAKDSTETDEVVGKYAKKLETNTNCNKQIEDSHTNSEEVKDVDVSKNSRVLQQSNGTQNLMKFKDLLKKQRILKENVNGFSTNNEIPLRDANNDLKDNRYIKNTRSIKLSSFPTSFRKPNVQNDTSPVKILRPPHLIEIQLVDKPETNLDVAVENLDLTRTEMSVKDAKIHQETSTKSVERTCDVSPSVLLQNKLKYYSLTKQRLSSDENTQNTFENNNVTCPDEKYTPLRRPKN